MHGGPQSAPIMHIHDAATSPHPQSMHHRYCSMHDTGQHACGGSITPHTDPQAVHCCSMHDTGQHACEGFIIHHTHRRCIPTVVLCMTQRMHACEGSINHHTHRRCIPAVDPCITQRMHACEAASLPTPTHRRCFVVLCMIPGSTHVRAASLPTPTGSALLFYASHRA